VLWVLLISETVIFALVMGRIMAIDYGKKRTGIAVSDELQMIASGLTTVATPELFSFLETYFKEEKVVQLIVGEPTQKDGTPSEIETEIQTFLKKFSQKFPEIPVVRVDERYTSKMAFQTMIDGGLKKKQRRNKALIDEISATIILQQYLY
jgi:putative Holliday junction resolvase